MTQAALWWIACGALIAVELFTLTLYLLMLALGAAAGAIAAHLGAPLTAQMAVAAFTGALAPRQQRCAGQRRPECESGRGRHRPD